MVFNLNLTILLGPILNEFIKNAKTQHPRNYPRYFSRKMVIILDDEDRENEGDLVCAAEAVSAETINFMAKHGRGLICLTLILKM